MDDATYTQQLTRECRRLEEDVLYTEKGHFTAARRLRIVHLALGTIATAGAVIAGARAFSSGAGSKFAGVAGLTAALVTAISTFAKPQELAENHHQVGTRYAALRGRLRRFRELTLLQDEAEPGAHQVALEAFGRPEGEAGHGGPEHPTLCIPGGQAKRRGGRGYLQTRSRQ